MGGPLLTWDTQTGKIEQYPQLVHNQSVVTLAISGNLIAGGTTVGGGGGRHPTEKEARFFLWDPKTRTKLFETAPVPGAGQITDLVAAPNRMIYGIAAKPSFAFDLDRGGGKEKHSILFAFDPGSRRLFFAKSFPSQVRYTIQLP